MPETGETRVLFFKLHPWHGIPTGDHYSEIVPTDTVKY